MTPGVRNGSTDNTGSPEDCARVTDGPDAEDDGRGVVDVLQRDGEETKDGVKVHASNKDNTECKTDNFLALENRLGNHWIFMRTRSFPGGKGQEQDDA